LRIAGQFVEAQEIVLHSGAAQENGSKFQNDTTNSTSSKDSNTTSVPMFINTSIYINWIICIFVLIMIVEESLFYTRKYIELSLASF
jgi:hypothetical protein